MVAKATCWLWPVYRPRNPVDSAEAASESIAAPLRTSFHRHEDSDSGEDRSNAAISPRPVTLAHRTDVNPHDTEAMQKSSHRLRNILRRGWRRRSVASAPRCELRPIRWVCRHRPGDRTLGSSTGSEPEPEPEPNPDAAQAERVNRRDGYTFSLCSWTRAVSAGSWRSPRVARGPGPWIAGRW